MKIVISNLNHLMTEDDLRDILDSNDISIFQIRSVEQPGTGRLITYAHLRTEDRTAGEQLIKRLHNSEIRGNVVGVKEEK